MKKGMKILSCMMVVAMLFSMSMVFADLPTGISVSAEPPSQDATTTAQRILGVIQWLGYAIAVGMLIYIGIKYVMASADEKANLKNSLIRYVIGAVLIAGAATIAGWVFEIGRIGGNAHM